MGCSAWLASLLGSLEQSRLNRACWPSACTCSFPRALLPSTCRCSCRCCCLTREHLGQHPCDKRRPISEVAPAFPAVDFSLVRLRRRLCRLMSFSYCAACCGTLPLLGRLPAPSPLALPLRAALAVLGIVKTHALPFPRPCR